MGTVPHGKITVQTPQSAANTVATSIGFSNRFMSTLRARPFADPSGSPSARLPSKASFFGASWGMQPNTSPDLYHRYLTSPSLELPPNILTYRLTCCKHDDMIKTGSVLSIVIFSHTAWSRCRLLHRNRSGGVVDRVEAARSLLSSLHLVRPLSAAVHDLRDISSCRQVHGSPLSRVADTP